MASNPVQIIEQNVRMDICSLSMEISNIARKLGFNACIIPSRSTIPGGKHSATRYIHIHRGGRNWQVRLSDHPATSIGIKDYGRADLDIVMPTSRSYIDITVASFFRWIAEQGE